MIKNLSKCKELGYLDKGTGKHQSCSVYSYTYLSPTIAAVFWKEPIKIVYKNGHKEDKIPG